MTKQIYNSSAIKAARQTVVKQANNKENYKFYKVEINKEEGSVKYKPKRK